MTWKPTHRSKSSGVEVMARFTLNGYTYRYNDGHPDSCLPHHKFRDIFETIPDPPPPMPEPLVVERVKVAYCIASANGTRMVRVLEGYLDATDIAALLAYLPAAMEWQRGAE